jgi:hypothetical protein
MAKRKATTPATGAGHRSKRTKTTTSDVFVWNPREWKKNANVTYNVSIMAKISDRKQKVVKKVLGLPEGEVCPHELDSSRDSGLQQDCDAHRLFSCRSGRGT